MSTEIINEKLNVKFKGTAWEVEFESYSKCAKI